MRTCVFVGPTLRPQDLPRRRHRRAAAGRPRGRLPDRAAPAAGDRDHRRVLRRRARGLAQGDPVGDGRGHPRVRQRQHGRAARRRAACLRHGRRRPHLRGVSGRRARGRRRGRGDPWAVGDRLSCSVRGDGQHPPYAVRRPRLPRSSRRRAGMLWSALPRSSSITTGPSSGFWKPSTESLPSEEIDALRAWLPQGRVDQKREDALAMLDEMKALLASGPEPMQVDYTLGVDRGVGRCDRRRGGERGDRPWRVPGLGCR